MARRRHQLCAVRGCGTAVEAWQHLCGRCWRLLPADQRAAIVAARQERAFHIVSRLAIRAADWLNAHSPQAEAARRQGEA
ncbi:hypothetical protein [Allosphingosinicella indica]|uniref:Uncharacterized protein n=1 Tax=Allosphingosinicella indica TaxID=941907 RepID=A0A1X7GJD0_9SPHN|nr:hypothetical protein [Allosphingosinicella indica]SMF70627.1 hypothetical protein SAMN06295910_1912 [Allosphingosinicella indica]